MLQKITLGYVEPLDDGFDKEVFPSKVGGKPKWLDPTCPLSADKVICDECNKPMAMLLQLYAPEDEPAAAFHRMIYVFVCHNGRCHKVAASRCMRVFRSQLPEHNGLYIEKVGESTANTLLAGSGGRACGSEEEGDIDDDVEWEISRNIKLASLCVVCGLLGNKACSKCHTRHYCSRDHQIIDWESGHRNQCKRNEQTPEHGINIYRTIFPEHLIVSEEEEEENGIVDNSNIEDSDDDAEDNEGIKPEDMALVPVNSERVEDSAVDVDRAFLLFQNHTAKNSDQVLRYARAPDSNQAGEPLYVSDADKPELGVDVPKCGSCGAKREFEFQIMPQMLNYLSIDSTDPSSIDWGTLLVYTCSNNCSTEPEDCGRKTTTQKTDKSIAYLPEIICRQNFSSQGIGEKYVRAMHGDDSGFEQQFESLNV
ncbi:hypothetical protein IW140_003989 [Coemansia sp. RSA 1813]|nr:hypothetical protein LPJ74_002594 [Coemansia sp. RSA 1843]KAJ2088508.1 hypothetical protein IW138_004196 [Coemansia sp. RSA 986]KAJ2568261.1 hypothetical protein IW140_003989 [Coemansia sp. RSA 1813]